MQQKQAIHQQDTLIAYHRMQRVFYGNTALWVLCCAVLCCVVW